MSVEEPKDVSRPSEEEQQPQPEPPETPVSEPVVDELSDILGEYQESKTPSQDEVQALPVDNGIDPANRVESIHGIGCSYCNRTAHTQCYVCRSYFCSNCGVKDDQFLCKKCGASPNEIRPNFSVSPLRDDDGVTHEGKLITPMGDTYSVTRYIDSLSDDDLLAMLAEYQSKVKQAEQLLYSRIIVSNTISGAISERQRKKRLEGRAAKPIRTPDGKMTFSMPAPREVKSKTEKKVDAVGAISDALSKMDPTERNKLLDMLKALRK